ncbi:MAG: trypsin-like serine protease [Polyangiaceae bacterium]|nr:trypsin-like serine protease [Polyangiaceae bacterium]
MNTASKFTLTNVVFGSVLLSSAALVGCGGIDGASELDAAPDPSTWAEEDSPKWSGEAPEPAGTPPGGLTDEVLEPTLLEEPLIDKIGGVPPTPGRGSVRLELPSGSCSGGILNHQFILTAAHCTDLDLDSDGWLRTTITYDSPRGVLSWSNVWVKYFRHLHHTDRNLTEFLPGDESWDIAIGYIPSALGGIDSRDRLTISRKTPSIGSKLLMTGYGLVGTTGTDNRQRRMVASVVARTDHYVNWATHSSNPTAEVCNGDSGGPDLRDTGYADSRGPYWEAIVSVNSEVYGDPCSQAGQATRTSDKLAWIQGIVEINSSYTCRDFSAMNGLPSSYCWALQ